MISVLGTAVCAVAIVCAPVPASMKVLALIPIILAVGMALAEEIAIARARVRALPDADWEKVTRKPVRRQHRRLIPQQRQGGGA